MQQKYIFSYLYASGIDFTFLHFKLAQTENIQKEILALLYRRYTKKKRHFVPTAVFV